MRLETLSTRGPRRHRHGLFAAVSALLLVTTACDKPANQPADRSQNTSPSADKPAEPAAPEPIPASKPGNQLTLGPAKLIPKSTPDEFIELLADGTVKFVGVAPGVKITSDGKIVKADGTVSAVVGVDGSLKVDGRDSGIVLDDTGLTLHASNAAKKVIVKFEADGSVVMVPPPGPDLEMTAEGCTGPVARTCGLLLAMYVMTAGPK